MNNQNDNAALAAPPAQQAGAFPPASGSDLATAGWRWIGWIKNPPVFGMDYEQLKASALRIDHGEERMNIDRADGSGCDCYYRDQNTELRNAVSDSRPLDTSSDNP